MIFWNCYSNKIAAAMRWKGDILYGCNISGTVLSVGVCIYPASQPALVSGIAYGFSGMWVCRGIGLCIFICSV